MPGCRPHGRSPSGVIYGWRPSPRDEGAARSVLVGTPRDNGWPRTSPVEPLVVDGSPMASSPLCAVDIAEVGCLAVAGEEHDVRRRAPGRADLSGHQALVETLPVMQQCNHYAYHPDQPQHHL